MQVNQRLPGRRTVDLLFLLALFCVFAASSLAVVLIGAGVYRDTAAAMGSNFSRRTSLTYVAEKVRQGDCWESISVGELEGTPALVLDQTLDQGRYRTWIYEYDGRLWELFAAADAPVSPAGGQAILELRDFAVEWVEPDLLHISVVDTAGQRSELLLRPRCMDE